MPSSCRVSSSRRMRGKTERFSSVDTPAVRRSVLVGRSVGGALRWPAYSRLASSWNCRLELPEGPHAQAQGAIGGSPMDLMSDGVRQ